jgi:putative ABC transport system permease protein
MFLMVMSLDSSIKATLDAEFDRQDYDMIFTLRELQRVGRLTGLVEEVGGVEKADMWLVVPVTILHEGQKRQDAGMGSSLYGVGLEDPMYEPRIVAGRWLQPGDQRAVVINKDTAEDENLRVGDMLSLDLEEWGRSQWQVVGLYTSFLAFGGNFSVDAIYAPRPAVYQAVKKDGRASTLLVRTQAHSEEAVNAVVAQLETRFKGVQVDVAQSETEPNLRRTYTSSFSYLTGMLMVLAIISALVGGIGLMGSLWIGVIERTKEIGILRAIGALDRHIRGMFILEGLLQGLLSWLVTVPLALLVTPYMANALGMAMFGSRLDYRFNLQAAGIWLVVVVVISTFASLIPARNAARINLRQTLSYE